MQTLRAAVELAACVCALGDALCSCILVFMTRRAHCHRSCVVCLSSTSHVTLSLTQGAGASQVTEDRWADMHLERSLAMSTHWRACRQLGYTKELQFIKQTVPVLGLFTNNNMAFSQPQQRSPASSTDDRHLPTYVIHNTTNHLSQRRGRVADVRGFAPEPPMPSMRPTLFCSGDDSCMNGDLGVAKSGDISTRSNVGISRNRSRTSPMSSTDGDMVAPAPNKG